ncbi:NAD(P)-binding domain-containing protein [Streptomyces hainanensis]|uniref:Dimethylaniline monooxygenase n=1 Tax=Streptomyces hainanensis TaxID=402648 RepID=A0A4R4TQC6_9ACTN|nr:NAD(P)-binding domain-containing protein [Streptomyces hainanensis]TDC80170.1 dimethylaniline monooxygenase [Streptomyces hainanensis]
MHDLVVVGAGPYGLSVAAHAAAAGLDLRVLGRPMASWRDHMPDGMYLKSEPWASDLSEPVGGDTLAAYCADRGLRAEHGTPLSIGTFTRYGLWFADRLPVPVEDRTVTSVSAGPDGFRVETADGGALLARTVVLAVGVMPFVHLPETLRELPVGLASHSSDHRDLTRFKDTDVTVVGAGQAALETAALLAEQGARPTVVARAGGVRWNTLPQPLRRGPLARLRAPHSGLGTGWSTWVWSELPGAVRRLPAGSRAHIAATALGPAGAWWLRDRLEGVVPVRLGRELLRAESTDGGTVRVELATGEAGAGTEVLESGHVIAATGFVPDLRRLGILDPALRDGLRTVRGTGAPELSGGFESSRPGLFFAGLLTAPSFGPSMRFVHGASFTAPRLVRGVRQRLGGRRWPVRVPRPAARAAAGREPVAARAE